MTRLSVVVVSAMLLPVATEVGTKSSPIAVYERCEALEDEIKANMGEVRHLKDEATEAEKALAYYEYVLSENELDRLRL